MIIFVVVSANGQTLPVAGPCWIAGKVGAIASINRDCSSQWILGGMLGVIADLDEEALRPRLWPGHSRMCLGIAVRNHYNSRRLL